MITGRAGVETAWQNGSEKDGEKVSEQRDFPPQRDSSVGGATDAAEREESGGTQMEGCWPWASPDAPQDAPGRGSISSPVSSMGGM